MRSFIGTTATAVADGIAVNPTKIIATAVSSSKSIDSVTSMDARTNFVVGSAVHKNYCICWTGPICSNTDASQPNPTDCMCGTKVCG